MHAGGIPEPGQVAIKQHKKQYKIVLHHIFSPMKDKTRIMAEPDDIQYDHIIEVQDRPEEEAISKGFDKGCISVRRVALSNSLIGMFARLLSETQYIVFSIH